MPARDGSAFPDRLAALVEERRSQIVIGLDPDPAALWPGLSGRLANLPDAREGAPEGAARADSVEPRVRDEVAALTAAAVERHCLRVLEAVAGACVAAKLQAACFERLGAPGWASLAHVVDAARAAGLLVIVDGKRGDIPITAEAYAQALVGDTPGPYGRVAGLGADAFTVNPLLGRDSLEPFVNAAGSASAGCFCLVRTSNPGAAELQDEPAGAPLYERIARLVDEIGRGLRGACGLSAVGAVVGATRPDLLERLRELMPAAVFLLPGVGAQGGAVERLAPAFRPQPAAGLLAASRSIVAAYGERGGDPERAAASAAEELRSSAWNLLP